MEVTEVYIDSDDWTHGSLDHPSITLRDPITQVIGFQVSDAQIPLSFFNIDEDNNKFWYRPPGASTTYIITIPAGDYASVEELELGITEGLTAAAVPLLVVNASGGYLRFTIAAPDVNVAPPAIGFDLNSGHAGDALGLEYDKQHPFELVGGLAWELNSTSLPLLEVPKYLYLCSDLSQLVHHQIRCNDFNSGHIISKLPLENGQSLLQDVTSGTPYVMVNKNTASNPTLFFRFTETVIDNMSFYLTRKNRQVPVPLRGKAFSVTLLFLCDRGNRLWQGKNFDQQ